MAPTGASAYQALKEIRGHLHAGYQGAIVDVGAAAAFAAESAVAWRSKTSMELLITLPLVMPHRYEHKTPQSQQYSAGWFWDGVHLDRRRRKIETGLKQRIDGITCPNPTVHSLIICGTANLEVLASKHVASPPWLALHVLYKRRELPGKRNLWKQRCRANRGHCQIVGRL
jgi:hypothetical protein